MWRVGNSMRELGVELDFLSTRRNRDFQKCHVKLVAESTNAYYAWPPNPFTVIQGLLRKPYGILECLSYIFNLSESSFYGKVKILAMIPAAIDLSEHCLKRGIKNIFVHSCADAAHLVNLCALSGGPSFSLRLGGDLDVYGKDHHSKMREAAFIVPAAQNNLEEIVDRVGISKKKIFWSWLGVDTRNFVPAKKKSFKADCLRIITVSRLNIAKGHEYVLKAVRHALDEGLDIEYQIAGTGPHEKFIRELIIGLNLELQVELLGALDETRVIDHLQRADAFVLGSVGKGEASPVAVIEAMACGIPVISTIIGGTANMISDKVNGFLVPKADEMALSKAIIRLARDPQLRKKLGKAARQRAEEFFDVRQVAARIIRATEAAILGEKDIASIVTERN